MLSAVPAALNDSEALAFQNQCPLSLDNGNYPGTVQPNSLDYAYNLE